MDQAFQGKARRFFNWKKGIDSFPSPFTHNSFVTKILSKEKNIKKGKKSIP